MGSAFALSHMTVAVCLTPSEPHRWYDGMSDRIGVTGSIRTHFVCAFWIGQQLVPNHVGAMSNG